MKIALAGTGFINKVHAQAAKILGLDLVAVVNHKQGSMNGIVDSDGSIMIKLKG